MSRKRYSASRLRDDRAREVRPSACVTVERNDSPGIGTGSQFRNADRGSGRAGAPLPCKPIKHLGRVRLVAQAMQMATMLSDLWYDVCQAARTFAKQPTFALAAVLTLALGIGAVAAIFSVVYGVLLKPLPFDEPERLVSVRQYAPHGAGTNQGPATYFTYRENQTAFEDVGV